MDDWWFIIHKYQNLFDPCHSVGHEVFPIFHFHKWYLMKIFTCNLCAPLVLSPRHSGSHVRRQQGLIHVGSRQATTLCKGLVLPVGVSLALCFLLLLIFLRSVFEGQGRNKCVSQWSSSLDIKISHKRHKSAVPEGCRPGYFALCRFDFIQPSSIFAADLILKKCSIWIAGKTPSFRLSRKKKKTTHKCKTKRNNNKKLLLIECFLKA